MTKTTTPLPDEDVSTLMDIGACFGAYSDDVRVLGNVRALDGRNAILRALNHIEAQAEHIAELEDALNGILDSGNLFAHHDIARAALAGRKPENI